MHWQRACAYCGCDIAVARVAGVVAVDVAILFVLPLPLLLLLLFPLLLHMACARWSMMRIRMVVMETSRTAGDYDDHIMVLLIKMIQCVCKRC